MSAVSRVIPICLLVLITLPFAIQSAEAQQREVSTPQVISTAGNATPELSDLSLDGFSREPARVQSPLDLEDDEDPSWLRRHPVLTGAILGAASGFAAYYIGSSRDEYCQDPDMFPCEIGIPFFVIGGAGLGAGIVAAVRAL